MTKADEVNLRPQSSLPRRNASNEARIVPQIPPRPVPSSSGAFSHPADSSRRTNDLNVVYPASQSSSAGMSRPPPPPPRKPDSLRKREVDQAAQIQTSGEDITFTKNDIIIAVMGVTGAGKSTFISLLSDEEIEIGHGLNSCTTKVGVYYFMYQGVRIFLVDTPGFDDTNRSDADVLKDVAFWLAAAYTKETQLAGIIYLHRISDIRMGGSALRNLRMFAKLCGANNLNSVVLATTHWTNLETGVTISESMGQARIKELVETQGFWGGMVDRGSRVVRHDGTRDSALKIVSDIIGRKVRVVLDIQRQLIDQRRDLNDTDAAQALQSELLAERRKFESKLADLKQDMEFAIQEKDEHWQKQIKEDQAKYQADIAKTHAETDKLKTTLAKISKEKDEQYRKLQEEMNRQRQIYEKQVKENTDALNAAREQQHRLAEEHEREKLREAARIAKLERDHQASMTEMESRIRQESNQVIVAQMEQARKDSERRYDEQREAADRAAEADRQRWEEQKREARAREQLLIAERNENKRTLEKIEREQKKSKVFLLDAVKSVCNVVALGLTLLLRGGVPGIS